jgi:hypothetical protein
MKTQSVSTWVLSHMLFVLGGLPVLGMAAESSASKSTFASLNGEVVLDNERVLVQKFVLRPGESTGSVSHPGDQLWVFVKGGVLKSKATGRSVLWRDGRVSWRSAGSSADQGSTNTGAALIEMFCVTLKPFVSPAATAGTGNKPKYQYLNYPNIPGEDLLENEQLIVQRFVVNPAQWEGVHAHRPNTLYIHIKGGQWAARSKKEPEHAYPDASPDGEVGWMPAIDISEGHESGNIGKEPIDLIWVSLKNY